MTDFITWIKFIAAFICAGLSYIFGGLDTFLRILILMIIIDYITGVCSAMYKKRAFKPQGI